jgi:lipopolysaccharide transport system ATP-binding protein
MGEIAIRAEQLGKRYRISSDNTRSSYKSLRESLVHSLGSTFRRSEKGPDKRRSVDLWALQDVSFQVDHAEVLGIVGRNGAGKSTLLKILSRITEPTTGRAEVYGRVGSLLEVGTGFHPELTGRENIVLSGAILGMSRAEIRRKFDEMVAFAEMEAFLDTPVKRYSSGMYMRLAFSVAAHLELEILVVDEVLAVGDAAFQKKCLGKMGDVARSGRTVLFVSHNMAAIASLCTKCIVIDRGRLTFEGCPEDAISHYLSTTSQDDPQLLNRADRLGTGDIRVTEIKVRDVDGNELSEVPCGRTIEVWMKYLNSTGGSNPKLITSLAVRTELGSPVFLQHNRMTGEALDIADEGWIVCRIPRLPLSPGRYSLSYSLIQNLDTVDGLDDATWLTVVEGDFFGHGEVPPRSHGVCLVEAHWRTAVNDRCPAG